jgi:hypothetical protein
MSAAPPVPADGGIGAEGSAGSQGKDGASRALLATHWRAIGLLQRGTEAVLGFLDLTKQLGKRSKASPLCVACP